jgi:ATP-dependent helicase/DNAse subunit B
MPADKFSAVWVSYSSMCDFLKCPRSYFLKNVYRDPNTGHKIQLTGPALSLGQTVHELLESLSVIPTDRRFSEPLLDKYELLWKKVTGRKGGFVSEDIEQLYKKRGEAMIKRVIAHPGPIARLAVKMKEDLPQFWLSEEDNIMLCGKIDWLEYIPDNDSVNIIDFKTGKNKEDPDSLQLSIYYLLVHSCQKRNVVKASYWYLELSDEPVEYALPEFDDAKVKILEIAKQIKVARALERYKCPQITGCSSCKPYEKIVRGEAELVGVNAYNQDVYIIDRDYFEESGIESVIL